MGETATATGQVLGYVVVDWNQGSGQPDVDTTGLYTTQEDAEHDAADRQAETHRVGRPEWHTVAAVVQLEEES